MKRDVDGSSRLMSLLTISELEKVIQDSCSWKQQVVHKALLVSGLSVLISATQLLNEDLEVSESNH